MKQVMNLIVAIMLFFATACTPEDKPLTPSPTTVGDITLTIGDQSFTATMEQNSTAEAFRALLPLTLEMQELNGNEKYYYYSTLPTSATRPGTIHAGDIMLFQSNTLVIFYETFESDYSYTRIGSVTDPDGLAEALGSGDVRVEWRT